MSNLQLASVFKVLWLVLTGCLISCTTVSIEFASKEQTEHPAAQTFIRYISSIPGTDKARELIAFYRPKDRQRIQNLKGWNLFAYTSAYRGLKSGRCEQLTLRKVHNNMVHIDCLGSYNFKQILGNTSIESMHIRVIMVQSDGEWYLDRSGLQHTQNGGETKYISRYGIKFKHSLNARK